MMEVKDLATKDRDEALARTVMQTALGIPVEQYDDQSRPAMVDLVFTDPDGRRAAAEVTSTRDRQNMRLRAAAHGRGFVARPELTRSWIVTVTPAARINELARCAPAHLAQLERDRIDRLPRDVDPAWPAELRSLGAASCVSLPSTAECPPGFRLIPFPTGAWSPSANEVIRACDWLLAVTPDVPAKLLASDCTVRHVVVVVTTDWLLGPNDTGKATLAEPLRGPFDAIENGPLPTTAPTLPNGVDCLWMVPETAPPIRAIYWLGDGVWHDIVVNQEQLDLVDDETSDQAP